MSVPVSLLHPERVAASSIRGYLTQAYYAVQCWFDLAPDEVLICEGNEDIDRVLLNEAGVAAQVQQQQIKDLTENISARDSGIRDVIFNFMESFHELHGASVPCRFIFRTMAALAKQQTVSDNPGNKAMAHLEVDVLATWQRLAVTSDSADFTALRRAVTELARSADALTSGASAALAYLEGASDRWQAFLLSVAWLTVEPGAADLARSLATRAKNDPRTRDLPAELFIARALGSILHVSSRGRLEDRMLRRSDLQALATTTSDDLVAWCTAHPSLTNRGIAEILEKVEEVVARVARLEQSNDPRARLERHTQRTLADLKRHAALTYEGQAVLIKRPHAAPIVAMANEGNVAIVGEAGAGKSAIVYAVASWLIGAGSDVVALFADSLSEADPDGALNETLATWSGDSPAYLVIDALDSPQDEAATDKMRRALRAVVGSGGRWRVVVSIRTYDLRFSPPTAKLFEGKAHHDHHDPTLSRVRHYRLPRLDDGELEQLRGPAPRVHALIESAAPALLELLRTPFNLSLASDLLSNSGPAVALSSVRTQLELLDNYWQHRVGEPTARKYPREQCMRELITSMTRTKRLRASVSSVSSPQYVAELLSSHILVHPAWSPNGAPDQTVLGFSHRLLFDYATAHTFLPSGSDELARVLLECPDLVLLARDGLEMYFERLWHSDPSRARFWTSAQAIAGNSPIREFVKVVAPTAGARLASGIADLEPLFALAKTEATGSESLARHVVLALLAGPRAQYPLAGDAAGPWLHLCFRLSELAATWAIDMAARLLAPAVADGTTLTAEQLELAGKAARNLFRWSRSASANHWFRAHTTELVCRTFASDPVASTALIRQVIVPSALESEGYEVLRRLGDSVPVLVRLDPQLVGEIYVAAFSIRDESDEKTDFGSKVMVLTSNRRQDYDRGLFALKQKFGTLLSANFAVATFALGRVVESYVEREHGRWLSAPATFSYRGVEAAVIADGSRSWSSRSHIDEVEMLHSWEGVAQQRLAETGPGGTSLVTDLAVQSRGYAVLWRSVLRVARRAPEGVRGEMVDLLRAPILSEDDTSKLAAQFLKETFPLLQSGARADIEQRILVLDGVDDEGGTSPSAEYYLRQVAPGLLTTAEAQALVTKTSSSSSAEKDESPRPRSRASRTARHGDDVEDESQGGELAHVIKVLQRLEGLATEAPPQDTREQFISLMTQAAALRGVSASGSKSVDRADMHIAMLSESASVWASSDVGANDLVRTELLRAAVSQYPKPPTGGADEDEALSYSPAQRISAAIGLCNLLYRSKSASDDVLDTIRRLASDPVATVRVQVARGLTCLFQCSPQVMWELLDQVVERDLSPNIALAAVHSLENIAGTDPRRVSMALTKVFDRFSQSAKAARNLREHAASTLSLVYVDLGTPEAGQKIFEIARDRHHEAAKVLFRLRHRLRATDAESTKPDARGRAWSLVDQMVDTALPVFTSAVARSTDGQRLTEDEQSVAKAAGSLLDTIARELFYASGTFRSLGEVDGEPKVDLATFFVESHDLLERLSHAGTPQIAHHLVQILEETARIEPERSLQLIAITMRNAERSRYGYAMDHQAADLAVRTMNYYLAEHRALLRDQENARKCLMDILDVFVRAGWPAAHELVYGLGAVFH